jgi:hypothetical protein
VNKLLAAAWIIFALDLVVLALMAWQVAAGDFGDSGDVEHSYALTVTIGMAVWLVVVNLVLVVSWWRDSRGVLWVALVGAALPLLWAWTAVVSAITDWAQAPQ